MSHCTKTGGRMAGFMGGFLLYGMTSSCATTHHYVLRAYSGYENKVKLALEDRIKVLHGAPGNRQAGELSRLPLPFSCNICVPWSYLTIERHA